MERVWLALGAASGLIGVAMAAVAAHLLAAAPTQAIAERAVAMQIWHALALIAVALWAPRGGTFAHLAGAAFVAGSVAFCGAVYALALTGLAFGLLAPVGGLLLMLGWALLGLSALRWRA